MAAVGLITGLGALTAPTHAEQPATPDPLTMAKSSSSSSISAAATLKSNKGKKLRVALSASSGSSGGFLAVSLVDKAGEQHSWSFKVPKKTLKLNGKGKGKLVTKKIKPFGKIKITIKPAKKWKATKCKGKLISKKRPLKITGLFQFDSKSAWGKVGGKKVKFKGGQLVKFTGKDGSACAKGGDGGDGGDGDKCPTASASWASYVGGQGMSSQWNIGASQTTLMASRTVNLAKPKGAVRSDFRSAVVPVPTTTAGESISMAVKSKGAVTGTATLTSATGYAIPRPCAGGKSYEETFWYDVAYQNGTKPLAMKMSAYGAIKLPNSSGTAVIQMRSNAS